ncbi:hypothetical protein AcW1_010251 [Taiwanofungus camphoratus]|nr:hypothetical protein AcV5_003785 [Antrodia cinnamomea]KAI0937694.1 hypothetical protein AcV7_003659 [Antrodia cinnamomea]KAI0937695.1 hypothetical protein AcV7_003659 [Antrodia cinnamomea]KAI0945222.1 hypothetical protein AcW1_010251 [Antrodia cinnamomea]
MRPAQSLSQQNGSSASSIRQDGLYPHRRGQVPAGQQHWPGAVSLSIALHSGPPWSRTLVVVGVRDPRAVDERGRKNKRFGFASVSNALLDMVRDHMCLRSSVLDLEGDVTPPRGRTRERTLEREEHEDQPRRKDRPTLGHAGEVLGTEVDNHKENGGDGWMKFRKGVSYFVQGPSFHIARRRE